jgi:hypothetical protein
VSLKKYPIGSRVEVLDNGPATVLRHGRDTGGVYTEVRHDDGTIRQYHREWFLRELPRHSRETK